jgi:hypothetical protein
MTNVPEGICNSRIQKDFFAKRCETKVPEGIASRLTRLFFLLENVRNDAKMGRNEGLLGGYR